MKILDELVITISEAEVVQNEDGTFSLKLTPKIYEDLYNVKEKVDSVERTLRTLNRVGDEEGHTNVGQAISACSTTLLGLLE